MEDLLIVYCGFMYLFYAGAVFESGLCGGNKVKTLLLFLISPVSIPFFLGANAYRNY